MSAATSDPAPVAAPIAARNASGSIAPAVRTGPEAIPVAVVATSAPLDAPTLATPTFVERVIDRFPDIPPLPVGPPLVEDPAFPLVIVGALALFVAITSRGDRRDPKLIRAELDARDREIGFS